jgi:hypothetical protein
MAWTPPSDAVEVAPTWTPPEDAVEATTRPKNTVFENLTGAVIEPVMQMATGFAAKPVAELAGLGSAAYNYATGGTGDAVGLKNKIQDALTYSPRTAGGKAVVENVLAPVGGAIESGAQALASSVTDNEIAQSGIKETLLQGLGFAGVKGAGKMSAVNAERAATLATKKANDTLRNTIRAEGQSIGLIAPAEGAVKAQVSNLGGAAPHVSAKNRATMTNALADEVGLPKGAITDTDVATRVKALSKNYSAVQSALGPEVSLTQGFKQAIDNIVTPMREKFAQDPKAFSALSEPIALLEQQVASGDLVRSSIVMDKIAQLRSDARSFARDTTGNPIKSEMAKTNLRLANLYEDLIDSNLSQTGKKALLTSFRDARKQLSQIHLIDAARHTDGLIDPQKFASEVGKYAGKKKFVSGKFKTVSDFANTFPEASKLVTESQFPSASRWELLSGGLGMTGAPLTGGVSLVGALPLAARAIVPSLARRGMLQGGTPNYRVPLTKQAVPAGMLGAAFSPYAVEEQP